MANGKWRFMGHRSNRCRLARDGKTYRNPNSWWSLLGYSLRWPWVAIEGNWLYVFEFVWERKS